MVPLVSFNQNFIYFLMLLSIQTSTLTTRMFSQLAIQPYHKAKLQELFLSVFLIENHPFDIYYNIKHKQSTLFILIIFEFVELYINIFHQPKCITFQKKFFFISINYPFYIPYMEIHKQRQNSSVHKLKVSPSNTRHSSSVSYDSFLFIDNVTNNKIILKDARKHYEKNKITSQNKLQDEKQVNTLNQCLSTLKSTKLFQMDSLRNKIFKSTHTSKQSSNNNLQQTKRGLRVLIQSTINQLSMRQLRQCFVNSNHRVQPKIIALQTLSGYKLTKENIEMLLRKKSEKTQESQKIQKVHKRINEDTYLQQFKQQKDLLQQGNNYLQNNLKNNSSHLVRPKYHKQLYQKLYAACSGKKLTRKCQNKIKKSNQIEFSGIFNPIKKGKTANQIQKKLNSFQTIKNKQIIFSVENNLFFDVQILIMMNKQLIYSQDNQGNNLLHISAKNRNEELFNFILKKGGYQLLNAKNNLGRTPLDLAKLFGATLIVNICENYSPYSYF